MRLAHRRSRRASRDLTNATCLFVVLVSATPSANTARGSRLPLARLDLTHTSPPPLHSPESNHVASVPSHSNTRPALPKANQNAQQRRADPPDGQRPLVYNRVQVARPASRRRRHASRCARRGAGRHQPRGGGPGRGGLLRLWPGQPKRGGGLENDLAVDAPHVLVTDVHRVLPAGHVVVLRHVFLPVAIGQRRAAQRSQHDYRRQVYRRPGKGQITHSR
jgi:hypothetical protein